jgi:predicted PurR-regulated permease PerM
VPYGGVTPNKEVSVIGNVILLLALAVALYFAYTRLDRKGGNKEFAWGLTIFLAIAFLVVLLATLGFCPGTPGNQPRTLI